MNMLRRHWPWIFVLVALLLIPFLFYDWSKGRHSGFVLTLMSEIGVMAIFALSYNMLMGQAGLLSFGHAVLLGMGAYCAAHVVLLVKAGSFWLPTELVPLAGGLGSLTGCFIASILMGLIQTFAVVFDVSLADLLAKFGFTVTSSTPFAEVLNVTLPRVGALLPFLMLVLILVFRPRGLMGTRDT